MYQSIGQVIQWTPAVCLWLSLYGLLGYPAVLWAQSRIIPRNPSPPPAQAASPGANTAQPSSPAGPVTVTLKDNRLSVEAQEGDLRALIERIATQGNINVRHLDSLSSSRFSVRFCRFACG